LNENGKDIETEKDDRSWIVPKTWNSLFKALADPPNEEIFFVQGVIGTDGLVTLNPLVQMGGLPEDPTIEGEYELQIQSSAGETLYSTRFGYAAKPGLFDLHLPYTPGMGRIVVLNGGTNIFESLRSPNPPTVSFLPFPGISNESESVTVSWTGSDPDGDSLTYSLHYNCDESTPWVPIVANLVTTTYGVNLTQIPGGTCTIKVTASDGINSAYAVSEVFMTPPPGPTVQILTEAITYNVDEPILLKGLAFDLLYGVLPNENLSWYSDRDGELGTGSSLSVILSEGTHNLTLYAQDSAGNFSIAEMTIKVQNENILTGMGSLWVIGFLILAVMMILGAVFILWFVRKRLQPIPVVVQGTPGQLPGTVKDKQGRWWYQDPKSGTWSAWNGRSWQRAATSQTSVKAPTQVPKQRSIGSCLSTLLISGLVALLVFGVVSVVGLNIIPGQTIQPAQNVVFTDILKMGGGGLLLSLLGSLMLNGGIKSILTRQAVVEDEVGRRRVRSGCSAVLTGISQSFFGLLLLIAGSSLMALSLYQQVLPWLGSMGITVVF
ncbi:MAG: fibronectin type III domain-containing protein, partial [Anaerolineales bacterium]|nr:fibronectin type III domain-containing protein [Anaerolineales bacterium]